MVCRRWHCRGEIEERLIAASDRRMAEKAVRLGPDIMRMAEKSLLLQVLDQQWKEHLLSLVSCVRVSHYGLCAKRSAE